MDEYAWFAGNVEEKTHVVANKRANIVGLYDVYGNAAEYVWKDEGETPYTDTLQGEMRLSVGGSAGDIYNNLQLEAARLHPKSQKDEGTSFRLIRALR